MDYAVVLIYLVLAVLVFGFFFRVQLRAWWIRRKLKAAGAARGNVEPPALTTRLYQLNKVFEPFGNQGRERGRIDLQLVSGNQGRIDFRGDQFIAGFWH